MELSTRLERVLRESVKEDLNSGERLVAYHGTKSLFPFSEFDSAWIGTGLVSNTKTKYDGFFFTTEEENAEYYTEYFLCKVIIDEVKDNPLESKIPDTVLSFGYKRKQNYIIEDVLDGADISDIIVVPKNNLDTIKITEWFYVGDEATVFEAWDEFFGDEDEFITPDLIEDVLDSLNLSLSYLLKIPIFRDYYHKK